MATDKKALLQTDPRHYGHSAINNYVPRHWFQWGSCIVIDPVPDGVYYLLLYVPDWPTAGMTSSTDEPDDLPPEFHPCIIDFACYVLSIRLKKWKQAGKFYNAYIKNLKKRRNDYVKRKAELREIHHVPDNVAYKNGQPWAH